MAPDDDPMDPAALSIRSGDETRLENDTSSFPNQYFYNRNCTFGLIK
jgi:hypothetical protein